MSLNLDLPREAIEALGPDPERGALEAVLLFLIDEGKMSVARAGQILGFPDRPAAARWYASRGSVSAGLSYSSSLPAAKAVARARAKPYEPVGLSLEKAEVLLPGQGVSDQFLHDKRARDY